MDAQPPTAASGSQRGDRHDIANYPIGHVWMWHHDRFHTFNSTDKAWHTLWFYADGTYTWHTSDYIAAMWNYDPPPRP